MTSVDLWNAFVKKTKGSVSEKELLTMSKAEFAACVKRARMTAVEAARLEVQWQVFQTTHPICKRRFASMQSPADAKLSRKDAACQRRVEGLWAAAAGRAGELARRLAAVKDDAVARGAIESDEQAWQVQYLKDVAVAEAECPPALLERLQRESPFSPRIREPSLPEERQPSAAALPEASPAPSVVMSPAAPVAAAAAEQPPPVSPARSLLYTDLPPPDPGLIPPPVVPDPALIPPPVVPDPALTAAAALAAAQAAAGVEYPAPAAYAAPLPAAYVPTPMPAASTAGLYGLDDAAWEAEVASLRQCELEHFAELHRRRDAALGSVAPAPWEDMEVLDAWHKEWEARFHDKVRDLQQRRYPYLPSAAADPAVAAAEAAAHAALKAEQAEAAARHASVSQPAALRGVTAILSPSRTPACSVAEREPPTASPAAVETAASTHPSPQPTPPVAASPPRVASTPAAAASPRPKEKEEFAVPVLKKKPKLGNRTRLTTDAHIPAGADPESCTRLPHNKKAAQGLRTGVANHVWTETTQQGADRNPSVKVFGDTQVRSGNPSGMATPQKTKPFRPSRARALDAAVVGSNPCDMAQPVFATSPAGHATGRRAYDRNKQAEQPAGDAYMVAVPRPGAAQERKAAKDSSEKTSTTFGNRARGDFVYMKSDAMAARAKCQGHPNHTPSSPPAARGRARGAPVRDSGVMPGSAGW